MALAVLSVDDARYRGLLDTRGMPSPLEGRPLFWGAHSAADARYEIMAWNLDDLPLFIATARVLFGAYTRGECAIHSIAVDHGRGLLMLVGRDLVGAFERLDAPDGERVRVLRPRALARVYGRRRGSITGVTGLIRVSGGRVTKLYRGRHLGAFVHEAIVVGLLAAEPRYDDLLRPLRTRAARRPLGPVDRIGASVVEVELDLSLLILAEERRRSGFPPDDDAQLLALDGASRLLAAGYDLGVEDLLRAVRARNATLHCLYEELDHSVYAAVLDIDGQFCCAAVAAGDDAAEVVRRYPRYADAPECPLERGLAYDHQIDYVLRAMERARREDAPAYDDRHIVGAIESAPAPGRSLYDLCEEPPAARPPALRKAIMLAVLTALEHLHSKRIVHADLIEDQVRVEVRDAVRVTLLDFDRSLVLGPDGTAWFSDERSAYNEALVQYPPQINREGMTTAVDTYAFGALLFHMCIRPGTMVDEGGAESIPEEHEALNPRRGMARRLRRGRYSAPARVSREMAELIEDCRLINADLRPRTLPAEAGPAEGGPETLRARLEALPAEAFAWL